MNTIYCHKLNKEGNKLEFKPYSGEFGDKVISNICQEAWDGWLSHQTMLINEYRLNLLDAKAKEFLIQEADKYFFGEGSEKPKEYVPK